MHPIMIDRIQAYAVSVTPPRGPESSLGSMPVRNGMLVRLTTSDGAAGWGEAWCNYPPRGNLARLFLLEDVIAPALIGMALADFREFRPSCEARFARLARHTGEAGSFAHCLAAIDTALADIAAHMAGQPLAEFLNPEAHADVGVYASTPDVLQLEASVEEMVEAGHEAAKLKIGFDLASDTGLLARFQDLAAGRLGVMADANQGWSLAEAKVAVREMAGFGLRFMEEPIAADAPHEEWAELSAESAVPVAAGENIMSEQSFCDFAGRGGVQVLQPDVAKWGGVSGAFNVGRSVEDAGATCAMHFMGTAVGLAASAHALAATGSSGPMELDANPNPLRTELGNIDLTVRRGRMKVPVGNGIGFVPDPDALRAMTIGSAEIR